MHICVCVYIQVYMIYTHIHIYTQCSVFLTMGHGLKKVRVYCARLISYGSFQNKYPVSYFSSCYIIQALRMEVIPD